MDPYLEAQWLDVHASLIVYTRDYLEEQLPENLIARVEERVVFETEEAPDHWVYPDVRIAELRRGSGGGAAVAQRAVAEPVIVPVDAEPATETFINILEPGQKDRLITVIEILSLANKLPGEGQREYRRKQEDLQRRRVNLVEIDLLRRGQRVILAPYVRIPRRARTTYQACVWRSTKPEQCEVYPIPLRSRLPTIKIPLRRKDKDITLDLQAIVELAYRKGRYHATLDYREPPDPPLPAADAKWAHRMVKKPKKK
jgi:hypothetical protein